MAEDAKTFGQLGVDLSQNWSCKSSAIANWLAFRTSKPVNAPEKDLKSIVLYILRNALWILKVKLDINPLLSEVYHFPGEVQLVLV